MKALPRLRIPDLPTPVQIELGNTQHSTGAEVYGFRDLLFVRNTTVEAAERCFSAIKQVAAERAFCVLRGLGTLSGDEQVALSELFGGCRCFSTHTAWPGENPHCFLLSNDHSYGIRGGDTSSGIIASRVTCLSL